MKKIEGICTEVLRVDGSGSLTPQTVNGEAIPAKGTHGGGLTCGTAGGEASALAVEWEERLSLWEGGEGSRGTTPAVTGFFRFDGGTSCGGSDIGTVSFSKARYTRYIA